MKGPVIDGSELSLYGTPVALIDFETTWTGPEDASFSELKQHPVQVCVVRFALGISEPDVVLSTYIKPPVSIRKEATDLHGISDETVSDAPGISEVLPRILDALDGHTLAAYNLPFDWRVLRDSMIDEGLEPPPFYGLDPLVWARLSQRYEKGKRLSDVCRRYGIVLTPHDAEADAVASGKVMTLLLRDLSNGEHVRQEDLATVESAWKMTKREALIWEEEMEEFHRRRGAESPRRAWMNLVGSDRRFREGSK